MEPTLAGKTALVTGATSGIGKEVARGLVARGARVLVTARDADRARAVVDELAAGGGRADGTAASGGGHVEVVLGDFLRLDEVRRVSADVRQRVDRLDILVSNAGGVFPEFARTDDGFERTLALNHLAPFLLTAELLPLLRASAPARVVVVASAAHRSAERVPLDFRGDPKRRFRRLEVYGESKLANVMFTSGLAARLAGSSVTANCLHPGVVRTGFGRGGGWLFALGFRIASPVFRSAERGADTAIWLASAPEVATRSGEYFFDRRAQRTSALSYDRALGEQLWVASASATGVAEGAA